MRIIDIEKLTKNLDERENSDFEQNIIGGAELIVNQNGKRLFHKRYGVKSIESGLPLPEGTIYRAASMTKPITVAAVLIEVGKGNIDLDKYVSDYLDGYDNLCVGKLVDGKIVVGEPCKNKVKIYNILSHTSGIGSGDLGEAEFIEFAKGFTDATTLADSVEYHKDKPLFFDPFTSQLYSAFVAFDIAARIVEKVSGMKYSDYLKKNIFDKLGMKDTTFHPTKEQWDRFITVHNRTEDGKAEDVEMPKGCIFDSIPTSYECGGAGLATTAEDYSKFAEMLLNDGKNEKGEVVVPEEYIKLMRTPYVPESIMEGWERWGLGVRVITSPLHWLEVGSFGWSGAFGTHFWVDPVNKITAVYMKNSRFYGGAGSVTACNFEKDVMNSFED